MKVVFINNIPSPYRHFLFDNISKKLDSKIHFKVAYLSKSESVRCWSDLGKRNYETFLKVFYQKRNYKTTTSDKIVNYDYLNFILSQDLVVFFGYNYSTYLISAFVRKLFRKKNYLFCETTSLDKPPSKFKSLIKKTLIRFLFDRFAVPGKASELYLNNLGIPSSKITFVPNSSDLHPLNIQNYDLTKPSTIKLIFVGRLSKEKNLPLIINALRKSQLLFSLSIIGVGEEMNKLKRLAVDDDRIMFCGHYNEQELIKAYSQHDLLILPSSSEPWGLVVNEALNFGLAVLLSDKVGASADLVKDNGQIFKYNSKTDFLNKLDIVVDNLSTYKKNSFLLSKNYTAEIQSSSFIKFINQ